MRAHVIENGYVVNTIEVANLEILPGLVEATQGGIGWAFDGVSYTAPGLLVDNSGADSVVPDEISMRQARLALLEAGLLGAVKNAIDTSANEALAIEWEFASVVRRNSTTVESLISILNLTDAQVDEIFTLAETL